MNFEKSEERNMNNIETIVDGEHVVVTNHNFGYSRTYRDGMFVSSSGNDVKVGRNSIRAMDATAEQKFAELKNSNQKAA